MSDAIYIPPVETPYNVRAYGAVGDGVANDAPAIQAAIDAAHAAGGGTVSFPAGVYLSGVTNGVTPTIYLWSNITLRGVGGASIVRRATGGNAAPLFWNVGRMVGEGPSTGPYAATGLGDSRITIVNLVIDGNKGSSTTWVGNTNQEGIWLTSVTDSMILNCWFINNRTNGLALEYCKSVAVQGCCFTGNLKNGIYFPGSDKITIASCLAHDNGSGADGGSGVAMAASWYCTISGLISYSNAASGLMIARDTEYLSVTSGYIEGILTSVEAPGGNTPWVADHPGQPTYDGTTAYGVSHSVFSGITVRTPAGSARHGIALIKGAGNLIANCRILYASSDGIQLYGQSNSTVRGCKVWNVGGDAVGANQIGIYVYSDTTYPVGTGNVVEDCEVYDSRATPLTVFGLAVSKAGSGDVSGTKLRRNILNAGTTAALFVAAGVQVEQGYNSITTGAIASPVAAVMNPSEMYGTAAPASGTYALGDRLWNKSPSPGGTLCWVCTTAGTPGTWTAVTVN